MQKMETQFELKKNAPQCLKILDIIFLKNFVFTKKFIFFVNIVLKKLSSNIKKFSKI